MQLEPAYCSRPQAQKLSLRQHTPPPDLLHELTTSERLPRVSSLIPSGQLQREPSSRQALGFEVQLHVVTGLEVLVQQIGSTRPLAAEHDVTLAKPGPRLKSVL